MKLAGDRLFLALDAGSVDVALLVRGLGGRRVAAFQRIQLASGALVPSPSGQNLRHPEDVRDGLRRAIESLGRRPAACSLVLPDGVGRLALLTLPKGEDIREIVRFRLAPSLPWSSAEAIVDSLPAGAGRAVGAAVRRSVVAEYEQAVASVGLALERVHLAPLLGLAAVRRSGSRDAVHVLLGATAACFAVVNGTVVSLRNRRRDSTAGEALRLVEEATRTAGLTENGFRRQTIVLSGADSTRLCGEAALDAARPPAGLGDWPAAVEAVWLGGLLG